MSWYKFVKVIFSVGEIFIKFWKIFVIVSLKNSARISTVIKTLNISLFEWEILEFLCLLEEKILLNFKKKCFTLCSS